MRDLVQAPVPIPKLAKAFHRVVPRRNLPKRCFRPSVFFDELLVSQERPLSDGPIPLDGFCRWGPWNDVGGVDEILQLMQHDGSMTRMRERHMASVKVTNGYFLNGCDASVTLMASALPLAHKTTITGLELLYGLCDLAAI